MIGLDIGGTKCAVTVGQETPDGVRILDKKVVKTADCPDPYEMIDRLCRLAEEMTDDFSRIGVSCGGPLDSARGVILSPPNLPGWDEVPIVDILQKRYGGKAALCNDANACALAEWKYGAGRGCRNMIFLTFGTGLGAGLILDGKLYAGTNDMAGEIGHVRLEPQGPVGYGKAGSCEGFCSGGGLAQLGAAYAREAFSAGKTVSFCESPDKIGQITAKSVGDAAEAGHADAKAIYTACGERLGRLIAILTDLFNPERIVIGSIFQRSEGLLREAMERTLREEALPLSLSCLSVVPAELRENLGDLAALSVASTLTL